MDFLICKRKLCFHIPCNFKTEELLSIRHVLGHHRPWGGLGRNSKALYEPKDVKKLIWEVAFSNTSGMVEAEEPQIQQMLVSKGWFDL